MEDEHFYCESCNGELAAESDKLAAEGSEYGEDNVRHRCCEKLKEMLWKMKEKLKPLAEHLSGIKHLPLPEFGTLQARKVRAAARAATDKYTDPSRSAQAGTQMPFLGDTKAKAEDTKSETANGPMKVWPPWLIKHDPSLKVEKDARALLHVRNKDLTNRKLTITVMKDYGQYLVIFIWTYSLVG
uniref:Uncharacterized protein n=2 Tax=Opuntia streptacantha TaxID=393608 RepID=A0A7C9CH12_OPUST